MFRIGSQALTLVLWTSVTDAALCRPMPPSAPAQGAMSAASVIPRVNHYLVMRGSAVRFGWSAPFPLSHPIRKYSFASLRTPMITSSVNRFSFITASFAFRKGQIRDWFQYRGTGQLFSSRRKQIPAKSDHKTALRGKAVRVDCFATPSPSQQPAPGAMKCSVGNDRVRFRWLRREIASAAREETRFAVPHGRQTVI